MSADGRQDQSFRTFVNYLHGFSFRLGNEYEEIVSALKNFMTASALQRAYPHNFLILFTYKYEGLRFGSIQEVNRAESSRHYD